MLSLLGCPLSGLPSSRMSAGFSVDFTPLTLIGPGGGEQKPAPLGRFRQENSSAASSISEMAFSAFSFSFATAMPFGERFLIRVTSS